MQHSPVYLWTVLAYWVCYLLWGILTDPQTWQPADITKPQFGPEPTDKAFYWSLMLNQDE